MLLSIEERLKLKIDMVTSSIDETKSMCKLV